MKIEEIEPEALWRYYQRGYHCLVRSGLYFRQILRPALSHIYFLRAMPLLQAYARANHMLGDLPPGFGDQMEACPLTPRDLLHLDYAICLGIAETQGYDPGTLATTAVMDWPGPGGFGIFIAADAHGEIQADPSDEDIASLEEDEGDEDTKEEPNPPFDI